MHDPQPEFRPHAGQPEALDPLVRRILAPNPSPMTYRGTNTYLVGTRGIAVIDPGPEDPAHLTAILAALQPGQSITHILVTHAHRDHSPLSRELSRVTGAPILAYGDAFAGRSPAMQALALRGLVGGGEGVDTAFAPDQCLPDKAIVHGDGWEIEALHTPGHFGNHLSFGMGRTLFSGDVVMGWASSLVSPPDGDLAAFMTSLERLATGRWGVFLPGHGAPISDPVDRCANLLAHRRAREASILKELQNGAATAATLASRIYVDTPEALLPAATRNVFAHLIALTDRAQARPEAELSENAMFSVC